MPLNIPSNLPAIQQLLKENIFVMDSISAEQQDIRPLKIAILNLMPIKIATETDLLRLLSNTPLQIEIDFIKIKGHSHKNTSSAHMTTFYKTFDEIKRTNYDGMIITGAPVEHLPFNEVTYWDEITEIFKWSEKHVTSSLFICWGAQAGLFHFYGVPKYNLEKKKFGVFKHVVTDSKLPIFRGFDDYFYAPHSRHTEIRKEDIDKHSDLSIAAFSKDAGIHIVIGKNGRQIFATGHAEYSPNTLDGEYKRDIEKGVKIDIPENYYKDNDPQKSPINRWKGHANLLFSNWLNYYVYQETPYDLTPNADI